MSKVLNIVNGDAVLEAMREAGVVGSFLPWRDFLHEGPVPEGLSLEELSKVRAKFISDKGLGEYEAVYRDFQNRDNALKTFNKYDEILLWFEHDLYDQLQLIQLLDWFAKYASTDTHISIICPENYLGRSTPQELQNFLLYNKERVTHNHFIAAKKAWGAFSSEVPYSWCKLLDDDIEILPFLEDAVKRMLEEYPNNKNGLSRTAHQALISISNGKSHPDDIFEDYQRSEERIFMGDILFWDILKQLVESNLLNSMQNGQQLELTSLGKDILNGKKNWLDYKRIDTWIGGVHITPSNLWCWDIRSESIIKYNTTSNMDSLPR